MVGNEIKFLSRLIRRPKKPYLVIVGGMKIKDKIGALRNIIKRRTGFWWAVEWPTLFLRRTGLASENVPLRRKCFAGPRGS